MVYRVTPEPPRPSLSRPEPPQAIGPLREVHLHLHGVSAEGIAAILARTGKTMDLAREAHQPRRPSG